jgi:hypothetical protein
MGTNLRLAVVRYLDSGQTSFQGHLSNSHLLITVHIREKARPFDRAFRETYRLVDYLT